MAEDDASAASADLSIHLDESKELEEAPARGRTPRSTRRRQPRPRRNHAGNSASDEPKEIKEEQQQQQQRENNSSLSSGGVLLEMSLDSLSMVRDDLFQTSASDQIGDSLNEVDHASFLSVGRPVCVPALYQSDPTLHYSSAPASNYERRHSLTSHLNLDQAQHMAQEREKRLEALRSPGAYQAKGRALGAPIRKSVKTLSQREMHSHPDPPPATTTKEERRVSRRQERRARASQRQERRASCEEEEVIDADSSVFYKKRSLRDKFMDCVDCLVEAFGH